MPFTVTMPKLSPTMEEGTIVKWHKKVGDKVAPGDLIMEVASDKATVEHEALDGGFLRKILVNEGDEAKVNEPVALFTATANESIEGFEPAKPVEATKTEQVTVKAEKPKEVAASASIREAAFEPEAPQATVSFGFPRGKAADRQAVSPLARKVAEERGLDLSSVKGSGPRGRIMSRDLEQAQPSGTYGAGVRSQPTIPSGTYEDEKLSPMRRIAGRRLQDAKTFIPHFYVTKTIDAEPLIRCRDELKAGEIKVTFNDFMVRACALALRQHPEINSGFNSQKQTMIRFKTIDVSVAVTVDGGLITPIVRYADFKTVGEISAEVRELAERARQHKLQPEEYKGGSFTISNLGMYGVSDFVAVINPPQAAILAVSGIQEVPVVKGGVVVPGKVMRVTLSSDHRVIDGADAARFCNTLQHLLERPALLLV